MQCLFMYPYILFIVTIMLKVLVQSLASHCYVESDVGHSSSVMAFQPVNSFHYHSFIF